MADFRYSIIGSAATAATLLFFGRSIRTQGPYIIAYASFGPLNSQVFIANGDGYNGRP